ncbi:hypothetical protein [Paenibacillus sacheonensis]|uniref:Uncharacterized protein n=1 Tax=Paenibacillus sacheonensis TaxID=742054 RepID=A0A7X5BVK8_9BACL|nr:hypothetical protein [Paenibacillus sacheonensis]MBM7568339.1 hypothetical protein [Paenibacillus sacheonensis]NBC68478.1 hypothetical protein [Paenibacillus sacheonensis]
MNETTGTFLAGAIRWDAWFPTNASYPGFVDPSLYARYGSREPIDGWFDSEVPDHAERVDKQIQAAADGMLDFWAFVWYPDDDAHEGIRKLNNPLKDYLASAKHGLLQFALVLQTGWVAGRQQQERRGWRERNVPEFLTLMEDPQYVLVNGNRPLVFWMDTEFLDHEERGFGAAWAEELAYLADACKLAGLGAPYLVDMRNDYESAARFGFDGVSDYGPASHKGEGHYSFAELARHDRDKRKPEHGLAIVPGVSAVIDPSPRHNDAWTQAVGASYYGFSFEYPTYAEWFGHLSEMRDWMHANPQHTCSPPVMAIYAWNELDEGGPGIMPTKQEGTMFLDALRAAKTGVHPERIENRVNDSNPAIDYVGNWRRERGIAGCYNDDFTWSGAAGDSFSFSFEGTWLQLCGELNNAVAVVELDGVPVQEAKDCAAHGDGLSRSAAWFDASGLAPGSHRVKVTVGSHAEGEAADTRVALDVIRFG